MPVIGLWTDGRADVFVTPTLQHARAVRDAGADIVALDGTWRQRPGGLTLAQTVHQLKQDGPTVVMADCGSLADALEARDCGADIVGTALAGYTGERSPTDGPDLELITHIVNEMPGTPVFAEGRVRTPAQARRALEAGAYAVVVGTATTHPPHAPGSATPCGLRAEAVAPSVTRAQMRSRPPRLRVRRR